MHENSNKYLKFREEYPLFCYESFDYKIDNNGLNASFCFTIGEEITFRPTLQIVPRAFYRFDSLSKEQLDLLVFHIGMIELISYWKCTCSPKVIIKPAKLSDKQIAFFKKLYYYGLGEFFYLNEIQVSQTDFMQIESASDWILPRQHFDLKDECIVPIGGGKDSVVTLELLRNIFDVTPMIINPRGATIHCVEKGGFTMNDTIEVKRTIDPKLLELNSKGYLNGHTPFSAMLAFVTLLCSAVTQKKHIALSNESSANESTVPDSTVNHQYSKSLEFEKDFREYTAEFISPDFNYFSFLRPLSELQIASLFARLPQYHSVFRSCNAGSKTDIWCGNCPKCLFAFIILSPFIEPKKMTRIFGRNLLDDKQMQLYFDQLTGKDKTKPFECVGTIDEVQTALMLTKHRFYKEEKNVPYLLKDIEVAQQVVQQTKSIMRSMEPEHFLGNSFFTYLYRTLAFNCIHDALNVLKR